MRIAIVNDLLLAVEALRRVVSSVPGYQVCWIARDGAEAVRKCMVDRPDLILMDMLMPVMDGAEATKRIMRDCPTMILVVSSTLGGNFAKVFEAMGSGAVDAVKTPTLGKDSDVQGGAPLLVKIAAIAQMKDKSERSAMLKSGQLRQAETTNSEVAPSPIPLIASALPLADRTRLSKCSRAFRRICPRRSSSLSTSPPISLPAWRLG